MSRICRDKGRSTEQGTLRGVNLVGVIVPRKKVAVDVERHCDGRVAKALLDDLRLKPYPAGGDRIDTPARVEVAESVEPRVLCTEGRAPVFVDLASIARDAGRDHRWHEAAVDDVRVALDVAVAV